MHKPRKIRRRQSLPKLLVLTGLMVMLVAGGLFYKYSMATESPKATPVNKAVKKQDQTKKEEKPSPPRIDLQPTVEAWVAKSPGNYGIVVYDPIHKAIIASHNPDKQYFTASIYKLYVAYLSLMDFQSGKQDPNEVILSGQTRKQCVHKMIHSSDSPCGETMLNKMGQAELGKRLKSEFGLSGTSFPGFKTTSADVARLLTRLQAKQDLNEEHTKLLLDAMKTQVYRKGLPAGMPDAIVYDKVGFDSPDLWIDTAIITLPDGREYIVSIFGNGGVNSAKIADFGRTIYVKLAE